MRCYLYPVNLQGMFGDHYCNLTWDPPEDTGGYPILKYFIHRTDLTLDVDATIDVDGSISEYNDTNVVKGREYA